jgi:uroporphyrinogen-III synthase
MRTLNGKTVALLESRQSSELANMVSRLGGLPILAPAVRERATAEDFRPVLTRIAAGEFEMVIALTGAGVAALFAEADRHGQLDAVRDALRRMTVVCRGPKPQAALKRQGLGVNVITAKPHTSAGLLEALGDTPLGGVHVLLLHYGEHNATFSAALAARGAAIEDLCLYEWAMPDDAGPLREVVARMVSGEVDALLVTSQVQFRFLLEVARDIGQAEALIGALNDRVVVGAVGPVCAGALRAGGVVPDVLPASPNSASLVGAVADYFELMVKEP